MAHASAIEVIATREWLAKGYFCTPYEIDARRSLSGFLFCGSFRCRIGANEIPAFNNVSRRDANNSGIIYMPNYTVEKIVSATHLRKDGTEIISKNGKKMWRVTVHLKEFPGKYIVGFTPWEPDERFLGIWDFIISTKQWEGRTNYCFSLAALIKSENTKALATLSSLEASGRMHTFNDELICNISESLYKLEETVYELRGMFDTAVATGLIRGPKNL